MILSSEKKQSVGLNKKGREGFEKGESLEKEYSLSFHQKGIPLLISPLVLRSRGGGQVDLGRIEKRKGEWWIQLIEMKSGPFIAHRQRYRLKKSAIFLGHLFGYPIEQKYEMLEERR